MHHTEPSAVDARLAQSPWTGFNVLGFYDDDPDKVGDTVADRPVFSLDDRLPAIEAFGKRLGYPSG